jgi:uncharacterized membrane protein
VVLAVSGPRRVRDSDVARNVGDLERVLSVAGGGALALTALQRKGVGGVVLGLLGAELIRRGATGRCHLYEALGISTTGTHYPMSVQRAPHELASLAATVDAREAVKVERTITINAPREKLYAFWRDFRNHPRFIRHLESVEIIDDRHSRWSMALPGGRHVQWTSETINDVPNELLAWKTVGHTRVPHAGSVHFEDAPDGRGARVRLVLDYEPPGGRTGHLVFKLLRISPEQMADQDLRRFKALMESGDLVSAESRISA